MLDMDKVPWLTKEELQTRAEQLLSDYELFAERPIDPPVPVEHIIERYLGFTLEYDNLKQALCLNDILGATFLREKRIVIDEEVAEQNTGRLCFTCGHEIAHVVLHSRLFNDIQRHSPQNGTLGDILCREVSSKKRGEWQADYFSACLLMPEDKVLSAYTAAFGGSPVVFYNKKRCLRNSVFPGVVAFDPALDNIKECALIVMEAGNFTNVSKEAMSIRLQALNLFIDNTR